MKRTSTLKVLSSTYLLIVIILSAFNPIFAQTTNISGPAGSGAFGSTVTVLSNGNFVVADPLYDEAGKTDIGAVYLYNGSTRALISTLKGGTAGDMVGNQGIREVGSSNFVVISGLCDNGAVDQAGAVTWVNGTTGLSAVVSSSNSIIGTTVGDHIGNAGITVLTNGNYVIVSTEWDNGAAANAGAVTWCNGATGRSGAAGSSNSLVGSKANDLVGIGGIKVLSNGNYVVVSYQWDNGAATDAGAVTWGNGVSGTSGTVSSSNSLVGNTVGSTGDMVGYPYVVVLPNGNYVAASSNWGSNAGAVTWCNGTTGRTGVVSSGNSLVGTSGKVDAIGSNGIYVVKNGNYVVCSPNWSNGGTNGVGAITWCDGTTGRTGLVSSSNSLVGSAAIDWVGEKGITVLTNGNYVVSSPSWNNGGAFDAGAVTWCNGLTGTTGVVSSSNSLVGNKTSDNVGRVAATALPNGNYVVSSSFWGNGAASFAGAVTWGNGTTGISGVVSSSNSLVGSSAFDFVGYNGSTGANAITVLTNGNYVVGSTNWSKGGIGAAGAATWCDGTTGRTGLVSTSNSLVGSTANDQIGYRVTALTNGNFVVSSPSWTNGGLANAGSVTWCSGTAATIAAVSSSNSLVGTKNGDLISNIGVVPLTNGNYVVASQNWGNGVSGAVGAVTWGNGLTGITGGVSSTNSLVGSNANDLVGNGGVQAVSNGNYVISSSNWDNGALADAKATTWGNGITGVRGTINTCASVVGAIANGTAFANAYNNVYGYELVGKPSENTVSLFSPTAQTLGQHLDNQTVSLAGTGEVPFVNSSCRIIAKLLANGASPVSGSVTAKEWIESTQPAQYVSRHYEITPAANAATATGKVTLYFTQAEFNAFNALNTTKLPTGPADATGKANLLIEKRSGTSSNGTGLPATYSGSIVTINPADADIIWNSALSRWEVSFDVTGFSGFFVKTKSGTLPVQWLNVNGSINSSKQAVLSFKVNEFNVAGYTIEKSNDGRTFNAIASILSKGNGENTYGFTDAVSLDGIRYYRIKQTDADGTYSYSSIIKLSNESISTLTVYPNPVKDVVTISGAVTGTKAILSDINGKVLQQINITQNTFTMDMSRYSSGVYLFGVASGSVQKIIKE